MKKLAEFVIRYRWAVIVFFLALTAFMGFQMKNASFNPDLLTYLPEHLVASEIQSMEEAGKLKFFSLGVGGYDSSTLHKLSGQKVMKLQGYDFTGFFDWVNKSMRSVSVTAPGDVPQLRDRKSVV